MNRKVCCTGLILALTFSTKVWAGGLPPICMTVDKLVFEPGEKAPNRIQIWGTFVLLKERTEYGDPVRGYLYYTVQKGKEEECRKEWANLQKLAVGKTIIGFGACGLPKVDGHLRKLTEKPQHPVVFPCDQGFANCDTYAIDYLSVKKLQKSIAAKTSRQ